MINRRSFFSGVAACAVAAGTVMPAFELEPDAGNNALTRHEVGLTVTDQLDRFDLDDYAVICNESNNPPTAIQKDRLWVFILYKDNRNDGFQFFPISCETNQPLSILKGKITKGIEKRFAA